MVLEQEREKSILDFRTYNIHIKREHDVEIERERKESE